MLMNRFERRYPFPFFITSQKIMITNGIKTIYFNLAVLKMIECDSTHQSSNTAKLFFSSIRACVFILF